MSVKSPGKMTERFSFSQDNPSDVERPGACPGPLSPPGGRNGEPGAELPL